MTRHPSEYTTTPFFGYRVMVVDNGTEITDERSGDSVTINDNTVAFKGRVLFCTQPIFEKIREVAK